MSDILKKLYVTQMPDGSLWAVPVEFIARNRAMEYLDEFDGDIEKSLEKDTIPLFTNYPDQIADWAKNNMNWTDVMNVARQVGSSTAPDYKEGWTNGESYLWDGKKG